MKRNRKKKKKKKKKKENGGVGFGCYLPGQRLHRVTQQAGARLGKTLVFSFFPQNLQSDCDIISFRYLELQ